MHPVVELLGSARGGGVVVYQYIQKNSPKYPKIPKIHPNIPKINSKKMMYRIPVFKLQYTVYPI